LNTLLGNGTHVRFLAVYIRMSSGGVCAMLGQVGRKWVQLHAVRQMYRNVEGTTIRHVLHLSGNPDITWRCADIHVAAWLKGAPPWGRVCMQRRNAFTFNLNETCR
jgi:hypothetical protein